MIITLGSFLLLQCVPFLPIPFVVLQLPGMEVRRAQLDKNLVKTVPHVSEFARLFPESETGISYYSGHYGQRTWHATSILHGRYKLSMHIELELNRLATKVISWSDTECYLHDIASVTILDDERVRTEADDQYLRFSLDEWNLLVDSNGDFGVIGYEVVTNQPIPNVDKLRD